MKNQQKYSSLLQIFGLAFTAFIFIQAVNGQPTQDRPSRQSALEAFGNQEWEKALGSFTALSEQYPADPFYKYHRGVCLIRLSKNPLLAEQLLIEAARGSLIVKTVPADVMFWTGRARQMAGMYDEAKEAYLVFYESAGKKVSKEYRVEEYISQCNERRGMIKQELKLKPDTVSNNIDQHREKDPELLPATESIEGANEVLILSVDKNHDQLLEKALEVKENRDSANVLISDFLNIPRVRKNIQADTLSNMADSENVPPASIQTHIFSSFETGKETTSEKIEIDGEVPPGLIYRIQVAVFRNPVKPDYFKGISPVHGFLNEQSGVTTYYAGMFRRLSDAQPALNRVKSEGFRDAFIAAIFDKKSVSMERAAFLEKEWGGKPLYSITPIRPVNQLDTIPKTLVFRVEILRSLKPLTGDKLEEIKKVAGARGLDILINETKQNIYLIGKFLTFKSATEFSDLLMRNGYREAKVTAYLGDREVPVETARQLFEEDR